MMANYWPKGLPASFISENMFIVALCYIPHLSPFCILSFLNTSFFKLLTLIPHASSLFFAFILGLTLSLSNTVFAFLLNPPPPHPPPSQLLFVSQFGLYAWVCRRTYLCVCARGCVWVFARASPECLSAATASPSPRPTTIKMRS